MDSDQMRIELPKGRAMRWLCAPEHAVDREIHLRMMRALYDTRSIEYLGHGALSLVLIVAIVASLWIYRAYLARGLPELQVWHTHEVENEYRATDFPDGITFPQYKELEEQLFDELDDVIYDNAKGLLNRYNKASLVYPGDTGQQWNRSIELHSDQPRGGVLFIHGRCACRATARFLPDFEMRNLLTGSRLHEWAWTTSGIR